MSPCADETDLKQQSQRKLRRIEYEAQSMRKTYLNYGFVYGGRKKRDPMIREYIET